MPDAVGNASALATLVWVAAFFFGFTVLGSVTGFAVERALPAKKIFDVPLAKGQYRFELVGNAGFLAIAITTVTLALRSTNVRSERTRRSGGRRRTRGEGD